MIWDLSLTILLIAIAAICNAFMDTHAHHWSQSVFAKWGRFWQQESWRNKYRNGDPNRGRTWWPVQLTDGWHLSKTIMVFAVCAAVAYPQSRSLTQFLILWVVLGITWIVFFNAFYNDLLINKKK